MRKSKLTRCGKCGGKSKPFTMFANASTGETYALCINCMSSGAANRIDDLAEIDELIERQEKMIEELEPMVKESEDMELPPALEAFAFTPFKSYKMAQMTLAALKSRRLELLSKGENEERLQYELDKKIEEEKYEDAGDIQKRLDKLKAAPKKKRAAKKNKIKIAPANLFVSDEEADGRCPRCQQRFPKPPGLFHKFDIGDCHEMCLPCCVHEIPKHVKTVKMADEMIAEMENFADMMDKMALLGKMMADDREGVDLENKPPDGQEEPHTSGQEASQMMIKVLKMRRDFLARTGEDEEMTEAADLLNDMVKKVFGKNAIADLGPYPNSMETEEGAPKKKKKPKARPKQKKKKPAQQKGTAAEQQRARFLESYKKAMAWVREDEDTAETCPECNERPIKLPAIFEDYDLGPYEKMCLLCSLSKLALQVKTLKMADGMLEEMKGISKILDELVILNELHEAGELHKAKDLDITDMEVEAKMEKQFIARKVIDVLEHRKRFLENVGEDDSMVSMADMIVNMMQGMKEENDPMFDQLSDLIDEALEALDEEE
ncbi:MAG TPA: hypothetical protein ENJ95_17650 [Bacteroidetes bacterium]|nr:hypothetical protein [Bacteroidota bacterium]